MKKLWLILAVLVFVSVNASAQGTVILINFETKMEQAYQKAEKKARAKKESKDAQDFLDKKVAYYEKWAKDEALSEDKKERYQEYFELTASLAAVHRDIVTFAAEDEEAKIVYQKLTYQLEYLYDSWVAVKKLDSTLAKELQEVVTEHMYWVEASEEAFLLSGIANEIHRTFTVPQYRRDFVKIKGEDQGFFEGFFE